MHRIVNSIVFRGLTVIASAVIASVAAPTHAATYTWIGADNAVWSTSGTTFWSPTGAPLTSGSDSVVFASGTGGTTVSVSGTQYAISTTINRNTTFTGGAVATGTNLTVANNVNLSLLGWRMTSSSGTAFNSIGSGATVTVNGLANGGSMSATTLGANSLLSFAGGVNFNNNPGFGGSGTVAWATTSSNGANSFRFNLSDTAKLKINAGSGSPGTSSGNIITSGGTNTLLLERNFDFMTPTTTGTSGLLGLGLSRNMATGGAASTSAALTVAGGYTLSVNAIGLMSTNNSQKLLINSGTVVVGDFSTGKVQGVGFFDSNLNFRKAQSNGNVAFEVGSTTTGMLVLNADSSLNAATDASGTASYGVHLNLTGTTTLVNNGAWTSRNFGNTTIYQGLSVAQYATLSGTGPFDMRSGNSGQAIGKSVAFNGTVAPGDVVAGVNGVGTLTINSGTVTFGSASKVAISGSGATLDRLVLNAPVSVTSGAAIDFAAVSNLTQGRYQVVTGSSGVNTFTASNAPAAYTFGTSGTDAYLWAKPVFGTITATPAAAQVITGGTTDFTYTVANASPSGGQNLNFTSSSGSGIVGTVSGTTTVAAAGTSGAVSGFSFVGSTTGAGRTATFTVSDPNAVTTSATGTVSVDVYGHAAPSAAGTTIALPDSIVGYSGSLAGLSNATISNAAGYLVNLKTLGTTSAGGVSINNVSGVAAGGSAPISASASLDGTLGVGANMVGQSFTLTYADDSALAGASSSLGSQAITVTGRILDHATPAFATAAGVNVLDPLNTGTISLDFGSIDVLAGKQSLTYSLTNLASQVYGSSLTAGLALTNYTTDGSGFESGLSTFASLAASDTSSLFTAAFTPTTEGSFSKSYTLTFYDNQSVAGSTQQRNLTVNMQAVVVPEPGALAIAGVGVILAGWKLARRRR